MTAVSDDQIVDHSGLYLSRNAVQRGANAHGIALRDLGAMTDQQAIAPLLAAGYSDSSPGGGSFFYRQGDVVRCEGAITTPASPSAGDVIWTFPAEYRPIITQIFQLYDQGTDAAAYVKVVAEADTADHGGEVRWVSGAHGVGKVLYLAPITFLDPWRSH